MIDSLRTAVQNDTPQKGYWKTLWSIVGDVRAGFRDIRYPTRDDKQAAWQRLSELVEEPRDRSDREKQ